MRFCRLNFPKTTKKTNFAEIRIVVRLITQQNINQSMKTKLFILGFALFFASCTDDNTTAKNGVEEIQTEGKIASIIRNPVSLQSSDTINVARLTFEETEYDFGEIDEGGVVKHTFEFTNTGKAPLIITHARSTCGCTIPKWPENPIPAGEKGEIYVEFDTKGKGGYQGKPVTVTANTFPSQTVVTVKGRVNEK